MVAFTLQQGGFKTEEAADGREALTKLQGGSFELIVTDLNMPNLDGVQFIRAARQHGAHRFTPILMLTTESQESKKQEGKAAGATGWLVKPFDPQKLLAIVSKVVR